MIEQEELIQEIRERLGEMPKRALPFDLLAFATTIGERYSEAEALGVNYLIGSSSR
jgi:vacuolar-type H+-ATPase catalytic subunit A/Vma1